MRGGLVGSALVEHTGGGLRRRQTGIQPGGAGGLAVIEGFQPVHGGGGMKVGAHLHAMSAGITGQSGGRVETHRLSTRNRSARNAAG